MLLGLKKITLASTLGLILAFGRMVFGQLLQLPLIQVFISLKLSRPRSMEELSMEVVMKRVPWEVNFLPWPLMRLMVGLA